MPELDEQEIKFNAFNILVFIISIKFLLYGHIDHIIDIINYIINMDMVSVMFIMAHILLVCFILSSLQFEIKFNATAKFNLGLTN
jgi:hypothetical protein